MIRSLSPERLATLLGEFSRTPAYRGLQQGLQELIGDGRIPVGTRLPSERTVAAALNLSRNTVSRVYADLIAAGFASARQGSGTYAAVPPERLRAHDHALHSLGAGSMTDHAIDLNCAASPATPGVAAAYERALAVLPAYLGSDGYLPSGLPQLQALIADSYEARGLPTRAEQIVLTSGALSALAIVSRALSRPGDRILIESPVYSNAIEALRVGGGRLISSPLADPLAETGWDLDGIEATLGQTSPHLAYLIPDFQNPTGFLMPDALRARYAGALARAGTIAIVDEALQATGLDGQPMPAPFARYARDAISIGSTSKLFWGGLRVGWIRAPQTLVERIIRARVQIDLGSSLFDQLVVTELLGDPNLLTARRSQLRQRRDTLIQALRERLPDWRFRTPGGGLTLWVRLPHGSATRLAAEAGRAGVHVAPGPVFSVEGGADHWLRLPYAKPEEVLVEAVAKLDSIWNGMQASAGQRRPAPSLLVA